MTVSPAARFLPDSLSSDLHVACINGPAYDMPTCITKALMLGMSIFDAVAASTVILGLYPIATSQHSSTTVYQVSYHIRQLLFQSDNRIYP
jgi:hypothetical protein